MNAQKMEPGTAQLGHGLRQCGCRQHAVSGMQPDSKAQDRQRRCCACCKEQRPTVAGVMGFCVCVRHFNHRAAHDFDRMTSGFLVLIFCSVRPQLKLRSSGTFPFWNRR